MPPKKRVLSNIEIENAQIIFRNFSGRPSEFNPQGFRKFAVIFEDEQAKMLLKDGWNIKKTRDNDDGEPGVHFLPVDVSFERYPAQVHLISNNNKTLLDVSNISVLDSADIEKIDLVVRPYNWEAAGRTGVKAYLKVGYFTIIPDRFAEKYSNVPTTGSLNDPPFDPD